jgi:hypothetical protein
VNGFLARLPKKFTGEKDSLFKQWLGQMEIQVQKNILGSRIPYTGIFLGNKRGMKY